jgi:AcrR family transcriptional regulator
VPPARRTQAERSESTRGRLAAAAVDSLVERGWAATTAVEVCRRAGVTRGALVHHYPHLSALLADALATVYARMAERPLAGIDSLPALVDDAWARIGTREFKAVIEAWLAAANDVELRRELGPVIERFFKLVQPEELPIRDLLARPEAAAFFLTAREAMLGLALGRAISSGQPLPHEGIVLDDLRARATALQEELVG